MIRTVNRSHVLRVIFVAGCSGVLVCGGGVDADTTTSSSGQGGDGGGGGIGGGGGDGVGGGGGGAGGAGGAGGGPCEAFDEVCDGIDNDCDVLIDEELGEVTCGLGACQVTAPACVAGKPGPCVPLAPAPTEACEGTDDDCDGAVDEDCACLNGDTQSCYSGPMGTQGMGTCAGGTQTCQGGAWGPCEGETTPAAEACDGLDSDCDGQVDDGDPGGGAACMTGAPGVCAAGTTACVAGQVVCNQTAVASPEACDGLDNNCNGQVDDGDPGGGIACMTGLPGVCAAGVTACQGGSVTCSQTTAVSAEACDNLDNNCNGQADEGNPGGGVACTTGLQGACSAGTTACVSGAVACNQNTAASAEACDNVDNNCNGQTDEGNPGGGAACMTGLQGVCSAGTTACQGGSVACAQNVAASPEACDNLDNNCNGQVDEQNPGGGVACATGLPGVCAAGTTACQNGSVSCVQSAPASAEVCDAVDNDCDGQVDEGNPGGGGACVTGQQGICSAGTLSCQGGSLVCQPNAQPSVEVCGDALDNDCDGQVNDGCPACNTSVLVLSDNNVSINNLVASALTAEALSPTVIHGGASSYNGAPAASGFGAVLLLVGDEFANDMPSAGQSSIVNAWNGGTTGVLFTEWAAFKPTTNPPQWTTLSPLLILNRSGALVHDTAAQTFSLTSAHPVWAGLPNSFTTVPGAAPEAFNIGSVINGGSLIATVNGPGCSTCPAPGVVVKNGASRTVQIAHSAAWLNVAWINDPNLKLMLTNGAKWAAKCL
jgi:hypothetical protein